MAFSLPRGALLATFVVLAAALDLRVALRGNGDPLSAEAMREARAVVQRAAKPGDLVVHSPLFRMSELKELGDLSATPSVPSPKLRETRRIVAIDRTDYPIGGLGTPSSVVPIAASDGRIEVRIYEPKGDVDVPLYSLKDAILATTMRVERGAHTSPCTAPRGEGGYACPGEPEWLYVARRTLHIEGEDVDCVWAHPTTNPSPGVIVLTIPAQPVSPEGRRLVLEVAGAFNDDAVKQTADGASVRTDIVQGGASRGTLTVPNRIGWQRVRVNVEANQPIELKVSAASDGRRHHCLNAELVEVAK